MPTDLPCDIDFGDGVSRHPVRLYESAATAGFLVIYLAVGFYGAQRFVWEFLSDRRWKTVKDPSTVP